MTSPNAFVNDPCVTMSLSVERQQWQCVGSFTRRLFRFCVILVVLHNRIEDKRVSYTVSWVCYKSQTTFSGTFTPLSQVLKAKPENTLRTVYNKHFLSTFATLQ